jgi:hypothetical protein
MSADLTQNMYYYRDKDNNRQAVDLNDKRKLI